LNKKTFSINRQAMQFSLALGALFAAVIVISGTTSPLRAQDNEDNGAIVGYRILGEAVAGPHTIQLQVSPLAPITGTTRFAVRIRDAETGEDIDDAIVRVFGTPAEKGEKQYTPALNSPFDPVYYLAQLDLEESGLWAIDIEVESELGSGVTVMSIQVGARSRSSATGGTVIFALISLSFVLGIGWLWYSSKKALKRRAQQG
jgi:hypothetical protein